MVSATNAMNSEFVGFPFPLLTVYPNNLSIYKFDEADDIYKNILEDSNLVNIDSYAFAFTNISYIYLPSKLTTIGSFAFSSTNLSEVTIPASIINYEPSAFASCCTV